MNINLWFARDIHTDDIVSILDANQENKYICPICNSEVIPKSLESKKITPHFAHLDRSKCSSEAMIHWWYKHRFIEVGDTFTIKTDKEIQFTCKSFEVEKEYELSNGTYKPDLVVYTECGNEIVFEMANTNKKKVEDYIDQWIELEKIIVEVDIKSMINNNKVFNALYYKGKCFNFNKRDGGYYNTIGKLKEQMIANGNYNVEKVKQLDWFWKEVFKYNNGENDIEYLSGIIDDILSDYELRHLLYEILKSNNCSNLYKDYEKIKTMDNNMLFTSFISTISTSKLVDELNAYISSIDNRLNLRALIKDVGIYESYFNGSRKHTYKSRLVGYNYEIFINLYFNKSKLLSIPVTNRFMEIEDKYNYILNLCKNALVKKYKCCDCSKYFKITNEYLDYLLRKSYNLPKRCEDCRKKRK